MHEQTKRVVDWELQSHYHIFSPRVGEACLTGLARMLLSVDLAEESSAELRALRAFVKWKEEHNPIQVHRVGDHSAPKFPSAQILSRKDYIATYLSACTAAQVHEAVIRYWLDKVHPSGIDFYTPEVQPV